MGGVKAVAKVKAKVKVKAKAKADVKAVVEDKVAAPDVEETGKAVLLPYRKE